VPCLAGRGGRAAYSLVGLAEQENMAISGGARWR
jgi:hypothetical protein